MRKNLNMIFVNYTLLYISADFLCINKKRTLAESLNYLRIALQRYGYSLIYLLVFYCAAPNRP